MSKLPYIQFYTGDWLKDPSVRRLSKAAKGFLIDALCLLHENEDRGAFSSAGDAWSDKEIARSVGGDLAENLALLDEVLAKGALRKDSRGTVFNKRIKRDEEVRRARSKSGKKGGSNHLDKPGFIYFMRRASDGWVKIGASTRPQKRLYEIRRGLRSDSAELLETFPSEHMRKDEKAAHILATKLGNGVENEWFSLDEQSLAKVRDQLIPVKRNGERNIKRNYEDEDEDDNEGNSITVTNTKNRRPKDEQEVVDYCRHLGLPKSDGSAMWDRWEGNGFKNGGKAMNCWKATIRSWKANGYMASQKGSKFGNAGNGGSAPPMMS